MFSAIRQRDGRKNYKNATSQRLEATLGSPSPRKQNKTAEQDPSASEI